MIATAFRAHYTVTFDGDNHQRGSAENWCYTMLRGGFFIETDGGGGEGEGDGDGYIFHFDNALDGTDFRTEFRSLCGDLRASQKPFPLTP